MRYTALESAEKELLRHLRLGKSVRSPNGANRVRSLILAALASPAAQRLCRTYMVGPGDLCTACTEIIDATPGPLTSLSAITAVFNDPAQLETFLKEIQHATHGQTPLQRRLAVIACAKHRAAHLGTGAKFRPATTRGHLLKSSLQTKLPIVLLCAVLIVVAILLAVYLL